MNIIFFIFGNNLHDFENSASYCGNSNNDRKKTNFFDAYKNILRITMRHDRPNLLAIMLMKRNLVHEMNKFEIESELPS